MSYTFPRVRAFSGASAPFRAEIDIADLPVTGTIPTGLDGDFYRIGPDPQYPNSISNRIVNGDGMATVFRIRDGRVSFRSRYVRTEKFLLEKAAGRALFGDYRNPWTNDPSVFDADPNTANTHILYHGGRLLALKEDSRPFELDPESLESIGTWDFYGELDSRTVTAHPKIDHQTGEMLFFGAAADGHAGKTIAYYVADASGKITHKARIEAPYSSMMHDFAVTKDHVVFMVFPAVCELDRLKAGGPVFEWQPRRGTHIAIMPRYGTAAEVRWYRMGACNAFHTLNAYTDGDRVIVDLVKGSFNPFFPPRYLQPFLDPNGRGFSVDPATLTGRVAAIAVSLGAGVANTAGRALPLAPQPPNLKRWTFDLSGDRIGFTEQSLFGKICEFPRHDERFAGMPYRHGYLAAIDPRRPLCADPAGEAAFNTLAHLDLATGHPTLYHPGYGTTLGEPIFVPRTPDAAEGDGHLLCVAHRQRDHRADLLIFDATDITAGPVATAHLPIRLKAGFHGSWHASRTNAL